MALACGRALCGGGGGVIVIDRAGRVYLRGVYMAVYIAIWRAGRGAVLYGGGVLQG